MHYHEELGTSESILIVDDHASNVGSRCCGNYEEKFFAREKQVSRQQQVARYQ